MKRAALALLLALAAHNLYVLWRNQSVVAEGHRLSVKPRDIGKVAELNAHQVVYGQVAIFLYLEQRIAGSTLTVPPWMAPHRWFLERFARLSLVVAPGPIVIDAETAGAITRQAVHRQWLRAGNRRERRIWQDLHIVIDPASRDYVWAETAEQLGPIFLVPRERLP